MLKLVKIAKSNAAARHQSSFCIWPEVMTSMLLTNPQGLNNYDKGAMVLIYVTSHKHSHQFLIDYAE